MRVLVTGATGTVGSEVVRALCGQPGIEVLAASRGVDVATLPDGARRVRFDFRDDASVRTAMTGVDAWFLLAPLVDDQVAVVAGVLDAARASGVDHVVLLSARAVAWDEVSVLRAWQRRIEERVRAANGSAVILRPCSFMQNLTTAALPRARVDGTFALPMGTGRIPFVDARDLGAAAARCLVDHGRHRGATLTLTGPSALDGLELAREASGALGRDVSYVDDPPDEVRARGLERGMPPWLVDAGVAVYARARSGLEADTTDTLRELLGRDPCTVREFFDRTVAGAGQGVVA